MFGRSFACTPSRRGGWGARLAAASAAFLLFAATTAEAATFTVEGDRLVVSGSLHSDRDFEKFSALVRDNEQVKVIRMKDFFGGVKMSVFLLYPKFIRDRGLATEVDGPCISACALMFLGGVTRKLAPGADPKRSFIGLHGLSRAGKKVDSWEMTYVNALRRFTGGKFNEAAGKFAYNVPYDGFLAFYDSKALPAGLHSVLLCDTGGGKVSCSKVTDLESYKLGVYTP